MCLSWLKSFSIHILYPVLFKHLLRHYVVFLVNINFNGDVIFHHEDVLKLDIQFLILHYYK